MKNYCVNMTCAILGQVSEEAEYEAVIAADDSKAAVEEFLAATVLKPGESIHTIHVGPGKRIPPTSPIGNM